MVRQRHNTIQYWFVCQRETSGSSWQGLVGTITALMLRFQGLLLQFQGLHQPVNGLGLYLKGLTLTGKPGLKCRNGLGGFGLDKIGM